MTSAEKGSESGPASGMEPRDSPSPQHEDSKDATNSKPINARKRTKTGCLTCRKRRIKCDEGKPTCNNCIKSKRQCEGYNQRVIFKEPMNAFHAGFYGGSAYPPHHAMPMVDNQIPRLVQPRSSSGGGPLPIIAPKPPIAGYAQQYPQYGAGQYGFNGGELPMTPAQSDPDYGFFHGRPPDAYPAAAQSPPRVPSPQHDHDFGVVFSHAPFPVAEPRQEQSSLRAPGGTGDSHQHAPHITRVADKPSSQTRESMPGGMMTQQDAGYWHSDDEASMEDSDDEKLIARQQTSLINNEDGAEIARRVANLLDRHQHHTRTFRPFDGEDILATYVPSSTNSPLNDPQTAAVFWYFVNATGPCMSLYERHSLDAAPMFQGAPVPKARQHIWTYRFPIIALNHPALLQAILALGSLQMANIENAPPTAAMKHYHLSLRRIAKNYSSTFRRSQPATLAATLLLGFYEVWNSDHEKWCKHMWGARAIIKDIPFPSLTRAMIEHKRERRMRLEEERHRRQQDGFYVPYNEPHDPNPDEISSLLIHQMTGRPVIFEEQGSPEAQGNPRAAGKGVRLTECDLENYENLRDLYWWYCKMDVYQSILGGTKLFMSYDKWTQVQPRAPIGRIDSIFGTFDHLMLILGRLTNFNSLDLARKRRVWATSGPLNKGSSHSGASPPSFPGMLPSKGRVSIPTGFSPPKEEDDPVMEEPDLDLSTQNAMGEWESLCRAFEIFREQLGEDFNELGPGLYPAQDTPFGPALTYRTFSIAGIWLNYHMGLIVLQRCHPSMPPVALQAAGMAARQTAPLANRIARIAAGISGDLTDVLAVRTVVGSALIESCFSLFVAGVQYMDHAQREWTISRLHNIGRLTGWRSGRQIANGLESGWTKAAAMGRGPPYLRSEDRLHNTPSSIWDNPRRLDQRIKELEEREERLVLAKTEQTHYALGLLGMEQDLNKLELRDRG